MKHASLLFLSSLLLTSAAFAQTPLAKDPVVEGSAYTSPPSALDMAPASGELPASTAAQLEVRLSAIEDELRKLRGKNEENEFQMKKLSEALAKMQRDTEMRLNDMEQSKTKPGKAEEALAKPVAKPIAEERQPFAAAAIKPATPDTPNEPTATPPTATTAGDGTLHLPGDAGGQKFATPRELYNYAFRLLNQTKYEEAAGAFDNFTKQYPKDPLVGNAYYWMGETFYIRRDYVAAADSFRQGFEALPGGPKAPDNLLKLAMSLDALNRSKEACVVLQQIGAKFKKGSSNIVEKAEKEQKRIGCK